MLKVYHKVSGLPFLLELNLMKKAWRPYGVDVTLKAHSIKKIIEKGTTNGETLREARRDSKKKESTTKPKNNIIKIFGIGK